MDIISVIYYLLGGLAAVYIFRKLVFVLYKTFKSIRENALFRYDRDLAKRFVSDLKLPVGVIYPAWIFRHQLKLYGDLDKWDALWDVIDKNYDGDHHKFLDSYYQIRDTIIKSTEANSAYQEFIKMDMQKFQFKRPDGVSKNNVYNGENLGKLFFSVDLTKANFQALRYVSPDIVLGAETYPEFISKFSDMEYVAQSKYTRQVVFGKLNVDRQMTVERYITYKIWELISDIPGTLRSMSNDELIFEVNPEQGKDWMEDTSRKVIDAVKKELNIDVHTEWFTLKGWQMVSPTNSEVCQTFFEKIDYLSDESKLVCVPLPYHNIIYKLWKEEEIYDADKYFIYEKMVCKFTDDFKLVPLETKKKKDESDLQSAGPV